MLSNEMSMDKSRLWMQQNMNLNIDNTKSLPPFGIFALLVLWCQDEQERFQLWFESCSTSKSFRWRHSCRKESALAANLKLNIIENKFWKHFVFYSDCEQFDIATLLTKTKGFKWETERPIKAFAYGKVWVPTSGEIKDNTRFECSWLSRIWRNVEKD